MALLMMVGDGSLSILTHVVEDGIPYSVGGYGPN